MKITAEPRSDQLNAEDLLGGPQVVTIKGIIPGKAEQKYDIQLVNETRVWRPPLTVLRLLIAAWGNDAGAWIGRRAELYRDGSITFGGDQVGGIRVSRLSHLPDNKPLTVQLTVSRGKRAAHTVNPLPDDTPATVTADQIAASNDRDQLRHWWHTADDDTKNLIEARVAAISTMEGNQS